MLLYVCIIEGAFSVALAVAEKMKRIKESRSCFCFEAFVQSREGQKRRNAKDREKPNATGNRKMQFFLSFSYRKKAKG